MEIVLLILAMVLIAGALLVYIGMKRSHKGSDVDTNVEKPKFAESFSSKLNVKSKVKKVVDDSLNPLSEEIRHATETIVSNTESHKKSLENILNHMSLDTQEHVDKLGTLVRQLNENVVELIDQVGLLQEAVEAMTKKLGSIEVKENGIEKSHAEPLVQTLYSKMVDSLNPLGFRLDNLKENETGCAFRITLVNGQEGQYETIDNKEIQQELLSAFNPLITDSSVYDVVPPNATKIVVVKKGSLRKENGILKITEKQTIKFE